MTDFLSLHLNDPAQWQARLAVRLSGDPGGDADAILALLKEGQLIRMGTKARLGALETVWRSAVEALTQIELRMACCSIPLPPSMAAMAAAHERLVQALFGLYWQVSGELHDCREPWWGTSRRLIALTRAADLLTRSGLMSRLNYAELAPGFWARFHALLHEGEHTGHMQDHLEPRHDESPEPSLEERYIAFALLEASMPEGLPHQEISPLHRYFLELASRTHLLPSEALPEGLFVHFDLTDERPPALGTEARPLQNGSTRLFALEPVIHAIHDLLASHPYDFIPLGEGRAMLSRGTLERVSCLLGGRIRRHVHRQAVGAHGGYVHVWVGRSSIIRKLGRRPTAGMQLVREGIDSPPEATLELTPSPDRPAAPELWEMIARRHRMVDGAEGRAPVGGVSPVVASEEEPMTWALVDVSPGGLHLRSAGEIRDHLNMGEPVLVEFPQGTPGEQVMGILRWLRVHPHGDVDMGLEVIAHQAALLRVSGPGNNTTLWFDALLLGRTRLAEGPLLLVPNHDYRTGDQLVLQHGEGSTLVHLDERVLLTVAVSIFRCRPATLVDLGRDFLQGLPDTPH